MTFISNAENTSDKVFSHLEIRADFYEDGEVQHGRFFDTLQVTDEYQDTGEVTLSRIKKMAIADHTPNLQKKFRIWRCDIPRALKNGKRSLDRIRNTWCKVKLQLKASDNVSRNMEMHDVQVVYYN